jgi:hypothetical protein
LPSGSVAHWDCGWTTEGEAVCNLAGEAMMSERPIKKRAVNLFVDVELLDEAYASIFRGR